MLGSGDLYGSILVSWLGYGFSCWGSLRAVARSENPGGLVVLGGDNVPPPGRDRVN